MEELQNKRIFGVWGCMELPRGKMPLVAMGARRSVPMLPAFIQGQSHSLARNRFNLAFFGTVP